MKSVSQIAEGTTVWLPGGTGTSIENVFANRSEVLSYDKRWDARPVRYGPNQPSRDRSVGSLVPTSPKFCDHIEKRDVLAIRFVSGRMVETGLKHRWICRRRKGRQAWEWKSTDELREGDVVPSPLTAMHTGKAGTKQDGYFVGAMLGDGGMTGTTPEMHGNPADGVIEFFREYALTLGCNTTSILMHASTVRLRITDRRHRKNAAIDLLREYGVWGLRVDNKCLPDRTFSREFWIGALSGLIDTDGCVRIRRNPKGTLHGSVEFGVVSRRLAEQFADGMLRLGIPSIIRTRGVKTGNQTSRIGERPIRSRRPLYIVSISRATALVRLASFMDLQIGYKATKLRHLAENLSHVQPARSEMHGHDPTITLDRIASIERAGQKRTFSIMVDPTHLFIANGLVTGA